MTSSTSALRKHLSAPGIIRTLRQTFSTVPDKRRARSVEHTLTDTLCAALALFQFKFPSLLQFDHACQTKDARFANLRRLYGLNTVASDTQMRSILDEVAPSELRPSFRALHSSAQRGKVLEDFTVLGGRHLLAIDGTGLFSSTKISCPQCGVKKRKSGHTEFYHQLLVAAIVHPEQRTVLPLDFEPIVKADGTTKNDCERNAAKRLLHSIHAQYPQRRFLVLEDALAANGPHIQALTEHELDYIIGIKPDGNAYLFEQMLERFDTQSCTEWEETLADGSVCGYRFANELALNHTYPDLQVNMLEYWIVDKKGKLTNYSWVTNLPIEAQNVLEIAQAARSRWRIENEVFNTLKNQGYELEHNYGHGKQYLSSTLAGLMLLAFLSDQLQGHACRLYKAARTYAATQKSMWELMRSLLQMIQVPNWETLWRLMAGPGPDQPEMVLMNSS
jgi:hypothetical protein